MTPQRRRTDSRAIVGASIDDPGRFMSTAIDWRRVLTGLLVGIPCAVGLYAGTAKVLELRADSADRRLDTQRDFFLKQLEDARRETREGDARSIALLQREIDAVRQDVRELRAQQGKR